tara:strand:+ start:41 stop:337 length:297 start_codon:yes stop_codon:yes gene_type:complete
MKLTEKNQRVFYWGVITVILGLMAILYADYTHLEEVLEYSEQKASRQIRFTVNHWHQQVLTRDEKIKLLERDIVMMQEHHLQEIMEVIEHAGEKVIKD